MNRPDPAIRFDEVNILRGARPVLHSVSLEVGIAERLLIAGPNGAGKTTLLRSALGLIACHSGSITVLGEPVGSRRWRRHRHRVGYVHQESIQADLPISAYEVAEIGAAVAPRSERRSRVEAAMRRAGCLHLGERLYATLSGGEKQKVSIARCLSQDARVLVLDEPTSSLDAESRADFMGLLEELNAEAGLALLVVTHDADLLGRPGWGLRFMVDGRLQEPPGPEAPALRLLHGQALP